MNETAIQALRLRQVLEQSADELVNMADNAIPQERVNSLRREFGLSQLNNLQSVALETESPLVVVNWLRYQMGRRERQVRGWKESGLGDQVVADIQGLKPVAERITAQVYGETVQDQVREVHISLVRRYLGYLRRWYVAKGGQ